MNPIQSLQHMLNHLARTLPNLNRLGETGIFDEATLEAIMIFQRDFGLPVTGIVDQAAWNAITAAYYQNLFQTDTPPLLHVFPAGNSSITEGERGAEIFIVQAMISQLLNVFSNLEAADPDGLNHGTTTRNLRRIQALSSIPESGALNRATWAILAALYSAYVTRRALDTLHL